MSCDCMWAEAGFRSDVHVAQKTANQDFSVKQTAED